MTARHSILALVLAAAATSCAPPPPLPPAIPIAGTNDIVGNWHGTVLVKGAAYSGTITIGANGTWASETGAFHSHGTYRLAHGGASWHSMTTGATGTWTLRKVKGKTELYGQGSNDVTFVDTRAD